VHFQKSGHLALMTENNAGREVARWSVILVAKGQDHQPVWLSLQKTLCGNQSDYTRLKFFVLPGLFAPTTTQ